MDSDSFLVIEIVLLILFFGGEPDLMDGIVHFLMK